MCKLQNIEVIVWIGCVNENKIEKQNLIIIEMRSWLGKSIFKKTQIQYTEFECVLRMISFRREILSWKGDFLF